MKHQPTVGLLAILPAILPPSLPAGTITYSQKPDFSESMEGTLDNIGFIDLKKNDPENIVFFTSMSVADRFVPIGGECDDRVINLKLVSPNPTVTDAVPTAPELGRSDSKPLEMPSTEGDLNHIHIDQISK